MHAFTDDELVIYHLRSLSDVSVNTLTDQFSGAIFNAAFPSQEIRYQRQSILSEIDFEQVQPEEIAQEHMFKFLFPSAQGSTAQSMGIQIHLTTFTLATCYNIMRSLLVNKMLPLLSWRHVRR